MCITFSMYSILFYTPSKSTKVSVLFVLYMFPPKARLQLFCFRSDIFPLYYGQSSISSRTRFVYCLVCWEGKMKLRKTSELRPPRASRRSPTIQATDKMPCATISQCRTASIPKHRTSRPTQTSFGGEVIHSAANIPAPVAPEGTAPNVSTSSQLLSCSVAQLLSSSVALTLPPLLSHPCVPPTPTASSAKVFPLCA